MDKKIISTDKALFWSLLLFAFLVPIATSPAVIAGGIAIASWIFTGTFRKDRGWLKQEWTLPVLLFMLLPWAGLIWTTNLQMGLKFAQRSYYWLYAFAAFSATSVDGAHGRSKALVNAFLAGLAMSVIISVLQLVHLLPMGEGNTPTSFVSHISYTLFLAFGIVAASFYFKDAGSGRGKLLAAMLMAAFFFNLVIASGRSGYLAFVLLAPMAALNVFGRKHALRAGISLVVLTAIFLSAPMVRQRIRQAESDWNNSSPVASNAIGARFYMWKGALKIFCSHPMLGVGSGGYGDAMEQFRTNPSWPRAVQPHNSFLYMMVSFGLPGLASLLWLLYVFLKKGWKARSNIVGYSVLAYGLVLIIGSLTDTQVLSVQTAELFAVFMGLNAPEA
ncbi:MAG: O-antigen ligase family protein [Nitrospiraceae bacterium]|nr:O-antigen ligase family protein [Nitrospiraceae bacterium]